MVAIECRRDLASRQKREGDRARTGKLGTDAQACIPELAGDEPRRRRRQLLRVAADGTTRGRHRHARRLASNRSGAGAQDARERGACTRACTRSQESTRTRTNETVLVCDCVSKEWASASARALAPAPASASAWACTKTCARACDVVCTRLHADTEPCKTALFRRTSRGSQPRCVRGRTETANERTVKHPVSTAGADWSEAEACCSGWSRL
eukprot:6193140-Pleurochrysis_carterae.AAC.2